MDIKETLENALYSMGRFTTEECSEIAENLELALQQDAISYLNDPNLAKPNKNGGREPPRPPTNNNTNHRHKDK